MYTLDDNTKKRIITNLHYTGSLTGEAGPPISAKITTQQLLQQHRKKKKILSYHKMQRKDASHPDTTQEKQNNAT